MAIRLLQLLEVVLDLGRSPIARFPDGDVRLADEPIALTDLQLAVEQVQRGSYTQCAVL